MQVRRKNGFTLIELLVTIAIIAVLAGILFPVFARAREQARKADCQSNLKQIGIGMMMYVQDYDGTYPPLALQELPTSGANPLGMALWSQLIYPYTKNTQIFLCPDNANNYDAGYNIYGIQMYKQYEYNGEGILNVGMGTYSGFGVINTPSAGKWSTSTGGPVTDSQLTAAANTILVSDPSSAGGSAAGLLAESRYIGVYSYAINAMPVLHGGLTPPKASAGFNIGTMDNTGGGNYLFADGHVKFMEATIADNTTMWKVNQ